jgi:hypothetical protein
MRRDAIEQPNLNLLWHRLGPVIGALRQLLVFSPGRVRSMAKCFEERKPGFTQRPVRTIGVGEGECPPPFRDCLLDLAGSKERSRLRYSNQDFMDDCLCVLAPSPGHRLRVAQPQHRFWIEDITNRNGPR